MRERAVVHVAGPSGCGKTTFIESVLGAVGGLIVVARCVRDDTRRHARETAPKTHPELRRYRDGGASGAALFVFPESDIGSDAFFMTELMADYSQGVVLEGNNPLGYLDLAVFVAPPPAAGERLFVRRTRDRAREQRGKVDAIKRLLCEPDGVAELLGEIVGGPLVEFARKSPKLTEDTRANLLAGIAALRKAPQPKPTQHWAISDRYSGIEHAQLVVVNVRHDSERGAGEQLAADLVRLRKEEELFNDVLGFRGSRTPITVVVANLAQPSDPGRRKALVRVRRAFYSKT
jgi:energy-coupling factor transporter ATP-binding protein EcfA2